MGQDQFTRADGHPSRRKLLRASIVAAVGAGLASGRAVRAADPAVRARLGHGQAMTHPVQKTALKFAELVAERSKGQIAITVYPSSQLGSTEDMVQSLRLGTLDLHIAGDAFVEGLVARVSVVNLPGILRDNEHAKRAMYDVMLGRVYNSALNPLGVHTMGFITADFRHITNNRRPVTTLGDLRGLKIRVPNSKVSIAILTALGASPVPIDWTETFPALQQGVVDGQENPFVQIDATKLYEVQKYLTLSYHQWATYALLANQSFLARKLNPEQREIVLACGREACDYGWKLTVESGEAAFESLKKNGMQVATLDRAQVQAAAKPVWTDWIARIGAEAPALIEAIQKA